MVEVFKTNITNREHADALIAQIHDVFSQYNANFDLEDCDRILRVKCMTGPVHPFPLIALLNTFGLDAEVLPDDQSVNQVMLSDDLYYV